MKRILYFIAIVFITASCFSDEPSFEKSYTLNANFEYSFDYATQFGPDSLWFDSATGAGIGYIDLAFYHKLNSDKTEVLGGFMVSYQEMPKAAEKEEGSSEAAEADDAVEEVVEVDRTYRAYLLTPSDARNTYLVFRDSDQMPEHDVEFMASDYGTCVMTNCYVTNTLEVAEALAKNFEKGDKLVLRATGYLGDSKSGSLTKTGTAEISLAEFSSQKDSIVSKWTNFDLSNLGSVHFVDFELDVQSNNPDVQIPELFCLDNMIATINVSY